MDAGTRFGPYRVLSELGTGGMGAVYLAEGPDGKVALKLLHAGLLFAALTVTGWPYLLRVKLSEPALLRLVEEVEAGRADGKPARAGLIGVRSTSARQDCVLFYTEHGFLTECGLAHSRDGHLPKPEYWGQSFRHLFGRWYVFEERD